ncbi:MAG: tetratricopeptide repeat protein [Chthoniobacter sp.]|nr:tetratricopeptide repeat protein [Chthoniobacter sp.]
MKSSLLLRFIAVGLAVRWHRLLAWVILLLAGGIIYAPALGGDLIWDDYYLVRENPFFRSPVFGWEVFRHYLFFDSFSTYYRPVQNWSYILDYWLWRGEPAGYHLTNILLHCVSGIFLFELLSQLLPALLGHNNTPPRRRTLSIAALLIALVWVVHPIHNAAVAYISGRADSLASFFALLAWLLARRASGAGSLPARAGLGAAAMLAMLLALCSKEIALVWLAIFALHTLAFEPAWSWRAKGQALAGALVVLGGYAVLHALPEFRAPMADSPPTPLAERFLLMLRALGDYTGLILWPARLYMERTLSDSAIYRSVAAWREGVRWELLSVGGLLAVVAALALCRMRGEARRLRIFGALWFVAAFLPISNLFPLNAEVAEHWIYLASIGALLLLAGTALALPPRAQLAVGLATLLAVGALGWRTAVRANDWTNTETFCLRTIQDGGATPRILTTLASFYGDRRDFPRQETILRKLTARFPDYAPARINLGICLAQQGRTAEAEPLLRAERADADADSRRFPKTWRAALHLAGLHQQNQRPAEALAVLTEARKRFPDTWELVKYESEIRGVAALPAVAAFAEAHWWHFDAWSTLGRMRARGGQPDAAIAAWRAASRLDIYAAGPLADIAQLELERQRPQAALAEQLAAIARDPEQPRQYLVLGQILETLGRSSEAIAAVHKARSLAAEGRPDAD